MSTGHTHPSAPPSAPPTYEPGTGASDAQAATWSLDAGPLNGVVASLSGLVAFALAFPEWFNQPSLVVWAGACALLGTCLVQGSLVRMKRWSRRR